MLQSLELTKRCRPKSGIFENVSGFMIENDSEVSGLTYVQNNLAEAGYACRAVTTCLSSWHCMPRHRTVEEHELCEW